MANMPRITAVRRKPSRSWSGSMAQAIAGISSRLPNRLTELDQPMAFARCLLNQLLSIVVSGSQLPIPWPSAITRYAR